eukprot:CAMPEP_0113500014 /NCGR_PEP_ID=MMETSP0014_2-20120614/32073_1 /TAXON_ID=2857 /ORGANISM="Nitzschia sp." /LENGTH=233 /DNA_ID=CAMNT_0000394263 /DNA_START=213 /DNA_END=914 /DNA_ORIENTATION=+ /assembly_acc=CAM_ASM_000159
MMFFRTSSSSSSTLLSLVLLLSTTTSSVLAAVFQIPWQIPTRETGPYEPLTVSVDDVVDFVWDGFHNVFLYRSGSCDPSAGRMMIGNSSPTTLTFTEDDIGKTLTFVCAVDAHCLQGQLIDITVVDGGLASDIPSDMPSMIPSDMPSTIPSGAPITSAEEEERQVFVCDICDGGVMTKPESTLNIMGGSPVPTCEDMDTRAKSGEIPEGNECKVIQEFAKDPCGCEEGRRSLL